ncbi:LysE family translocator [Shewanella sp. C32]|uniref:LysE family translocator n=1 Tax=Shewanella electrica TaxID=515560 RepID=A0ABT2FIE3_9GAMM|nr:LysE family transporter [Shewanella electrica]MCH1924199.1 LysE family translocator [Shewanella electrica]MCS4556102.1 LysE family translocator [Shewanella electrica]
MLLSTLLPAAFPALALAHFVALLSPGQDFFLIIAHAIRHKLAGSRFICLGVALGNGIYIALVILGWANIRDNPLMFTLVETAGAIYLLWVGQKLLRSKRTDPLRSTTHAAAPSAMQQLLLGLNSALLNPKNALFYMSLMTVILGNDVTLPQQIACGVWMFLAVLLWDLLIAALIARPQVQQQLSAYIHLVERVAGAILITFGISLFTGYLS